MASITGLSAKNIKLMAHDGRLPKAIKRMNSNEPYRFKRREIEHWLNGDTENKQTIAEVVQQELVKLLRNTAPGLSH